MRNILFYVICALIAASPAFAGAKKPAASASDDAIAQARAAAAAEDSKDSGFAEEATQSLTVSENEAVKSADLQTATQANPTEEKKLTSDQMKNMKESEIPLASTEKQLKKGESSPWLRLLTTIAIVGALFGAATVGIKRYGKRGNSSKNNNTKFRVITNHHLGPKKSLMIVNVAGESLLLGVTDHNISILKNLSLLDEELPADVPNSFAGAINESFVDAASPVKPSQSRYADEDPADDFAVQGLAQIKDKVSSRLKNMRQI